jgi:hypothetical protein
MTKIKTALKLSAIELEVANSARDSFVNELAGMARDCAALVAASKDGKASKTFADIFKAAIVAAKLDYPAGEAGLVKARALFERGAKRTKEQAQAILAANARLSRRLIVAGLKSADARGAKRVIKAPAPVAPVAQGVTENPKTLRAPALANADEWATFLTGTAAFLRVTQKKNAKGLDHMARDCATEILAAIAKYEQRRAAK